MGDGVKKQQHQKHQEINTNNLINRTSTSLLPSPSRARSLRTFFEYPERIISSPHHPQPSTVDLFTTKTATTTKNQSSSTFYYHYQQQSDYQLFGGAVGDYHYNYVGGGADSSSYLPTYDSIFGQFRDDDDGKARKSNSWLHLKTILTMFLGKREFIWTQMSDFMI